MRFTTRTMCDDRTRGHGVLAALVLALVPPTAGRADEPGVLRPDRPASHPHRILVRFRDPIGGPAAAGVVLPGHRIVRRARSLTNLAVVSVPDGDTAAAIERYRDDPTVLYAEPDYRLSFAAEPNDPSFPMQWGLRNVGQTVDQDPGAAGVDIRAVVAWEHWAADPTFRIAVVDTGVDRTHPDLEANIWRNQREIAGNALDDDGNGWIDDVYGFNTVADNGDVSDPIGHGTHVAGIIGAVAGNSLGVSGVMWDVRLVVLRIADDDGASYVSDAVEAIEYILAGGIRLSNNSWGCYDCYSQALYDIMDVARMAGHVFVAAAGNGIFNVGVDTDRFPFFPASYDLPNVIAVAAVDNDGRRPKFSNFGPVSVDLGAPGVNILSTRPGAAYAYLDGTSMAAAYATGVTGLLMSRRPDLSAESVIDRILLTARDLQSLRGVTVTGGMLDAEAAVADCNHNGIPDEYDIINRVSADCDANGVPDECEPDCNGNGVADRCDLRDGTDVDCDDDGVPDACEPDCNENDIADPCDILTAGSTDCNEDGVPDECQPNHDADCNENASPDLCDLYTGVGRDCNDNLTLDQCDIAAGVSVDCSGNGLPDECERDCNGNGVADSCDILAGTSKDTDGDAVPDECVLGFALVPVAATQPHFIEDRTIHVIGGGERVTLEIRLSGWDLDQDGAPRLRFYQAAIDTAAYESGSAGALSPARLACADNDDCMADTECLPNGFCEAAAALAVDEAHAKFVFAGNTTVSLSDPLRSRLGSTMFFPAQAPVDPGSSRYGGTLVIDVSPDALGTFTVGFNTLDTLWADAGDPPASIPIPGFSAATISIMPDCNRNGSPDDRDISDGHSGDCDANGIPDECVPEEDDCNGNILPDSCDIAAGRSDDCNGNGTPDECILFELDCNHNQSPDRCDIDRGDSADCNANNIPDECIALEDDCNENNIPDACDITFGTSNDCNGNGVPDRCDRDCNDNGFEDSCDIADATSLDRDENGVPDECQTVLWVPFDFPTIQAAVDAADPGDIVRVADGVYGGEGNREIDLRGKVVTVRSAGGPERCVVDASGAQAGFVLVGGEAGGTRVEGFTVTNGSVSGIVVFAGSPTIRNCIITGNGPTAGGIYCDEGASPTIEYCTITANSSSWEGGGVRSIRSDPTVSHCLITNNSARLEGGGVYAYAGAITITHSTISENSSRQGGGGVAVRFGNPLIRSCSVLRNMAGGGTGAIGDGGGVLTIGTDAVIASTLIAGNRARVRGGGVYLDGGDPTLANCTIVGNNAEASGGGVYRPGGSGSRWACCHSDTCEDALTSAECTQLGGRWYPGLNCVDVECGTTSCCLPDGTCRNDIFFSCVTDDGVPGNGGSQCLLSDCTPTVSNSVLWNNDAGLGSEIYSGILPLNVVHSTVRNGWVGSDNADTDPGFLVDGFWDLDGDWIDGDYHLLATSGGVDTGSNQSVPTSLIADLDGHPRILCDFVDRGAYERGAGDFNCDEHVDLGDYRFWTGCLTGPDANADSASCQAFDYDADGDVDLADHAAFQRASAP